MKILFIGDIIGRPGRRAVSASLNRLLVEEQIDLAIANCENAAAGFGVTGKIADQLLDAGLHVLTSGNHIWDKREVFDYLDREPRLLRPHNYPDAPGSGLYMGHTDAGVPYAVINLQGRVYLPPIDCPFRQVDQLLTEIPPDVRVCFVDFHAEVTSEKNAFGRYLDGRVTAVVGTHTHVPTADERVFPGGTAYITDVGMTGPVSSIIGMKQEDSLKRFLTALPARFEPASGAVRLNAVVVDVDEGTGHARSIRRCAREYDSSGRPIMMD